MYLTVDCTYDLLNSLLYNCSYSISTKYESYIAQKLKEVNYIIFYGILFSSVVILKASNTSLITTYSGLTKCKRAGDFNRSSSSIDIGLCNELVSTRLEL